MSRDVDVTFEPCFLVVDESKEVYGHIEKTFDEWVFVPQIHMMSFIGTSIMLKITEKLVSLNEKDLDND